MPAFTQIDLENMAASHLKKMLANGSMEQNIQEMPLLKAMTANKTILRNVKDHKVHRNIVNRGGVTMAGFNSNEDEVTHVNPGNNRQAVFVVKDHYAGIEFSRDEMLRHSITIVESYDDAKPSKQDALQVIPVLEDKNRELVYGVANSKNLLLWGDGVADPKSMAGVRAFIKDNPAGVGETVGGIDQTVYTKWRNYSWVGANAIQADAANAADGRLIRALNQTIFPALNLNRNGRPKNYAYLIGSAVRNQLQDELYAKGQYSQSGFSGNFELMFGDATFEKNKFIWDPTLDDLGFENRGYLIDLNAIKLGAVEGNDDVVTKPMRPTNKFVFQKGILFYGGLVADQLNTSGVFEIAPVV